jgi:hypothetical protein
VSLDNCTLTGNLAEFGFGASIYAADQVNLVVVDSLFSDGVAMYVCCGENATTPYYKIPLADLKDSISKRPNISMLALAHCGLPFLVRMRGSLTTKLGRKR